MLGCFYCEEPSSASGSKLDIGVHTVVQMQAAVVESAGNLVEAQLIVHRDQR